MKARKLKIFGGSSFDSGGRQVSAAVAAYSQREAADALCMTLHEFRNFWTITGNKDTIAAIAKYPPLTVIMSSEVMTHDFNTVRVPDYLKNRGDK